METGEHERHAVPREETPRGEDPARLNDLNPDESTSESVRDPLQEWDQSNPQNSTRDPNKQRDRGTQEPIRNTNQRPTLPQSERDGETQPQDQRRDGTPSFVESGVSDGGQEGAYGQDSYKERRNEKSQDL